MIARARKPSWALIVAFWAAAWAMFASTRLILVFWLDPGSERYTRLVALLDYAVQYGLLALLTPLVFWLSGRFPVTRTNWKRTVPMHFGIGLAVTIATMAVMFLLHNVYAHASADRHSWSIASISTQIINYGYHYHVVFYMGILGAGFAFHFYRDLQEQRLATAQMQSQLTESRLQSLRMQLHPHFLFNTLNLVSQLAEEDPGAARRTIARLGDLLRRALESTAEREVSLAEEIRFATGYLEIIEARFADRLRIEMDIDPEVEQALVPNLLLQPLLENAVEHGAAKSLGPTLIRLEAWSIGDDLRISISDTGPKLDQSHSREGVGLSNTRARLEQMYGARAKLDLHAGAERGMTVEICLPLRTHADPDTAELVRAGRARDDA